MRKHEHEKMSQTTARRQEETAGTQVNSIQGPNSSGPGVVSPCPLGRPALRAFGQRNVFLRPGAHPSLPRYSILSITTKRYDDEPPL